MLKYRGFSLIEIMIVVAIIAILAVIALPSYAYFIERADLAHARTGLVEMNQALAQERIKNNLTGALVESTKTNFLSSVDSDVREKYDMVVRCGAINNPVPCSGTDGVSTYFLFAVPTTATSRKTSLWMSHNGTVYECSTKLSTYVPNTNAQVCQISN